MQGNSNLYKSLEAKRVVQELYDAKRSSLAFPVQEVDVETAFGRTRVMSASKEDGKRVVLFHGVHAGAPLTLESVAGLLEHYQLTVIESLGQATRSAEARVNIKDDSLALWADEVLEKLEIPAAEFIGVSYGAFILQKLITHRPGRVNKCIFVVPSGLANGDFWPSFTKLTLPLIKFHLTKKDKDLKKFLRHFVPDDDQFMIDFQRAILLGVHMDYRRPSILKRHDVAHFNHPVYMMLADDDVFFPADKTIRQAKAIFPNLAGVHTLGNCRHMPTKAHASEMEQTLAAWIG